MAFSNVALNPFLQNLISTGVVERQVREALVAETLYRRDITPEVFEGRMGEQRLIAREGLLPVNLLPLPVMTDPVPANYLLESFATEIQRWGDSVQAYIPNNYAAVKAETLSKSQRIGVNAAQTVDRLIRMRLYQAALAGNTVLTAAPGIGALAIHVASLNGFTVINSATDNRPVAVSAANPLAITFVGGEPANTVVGFAPDNPLAPFGPGWLTLGAATTVGPAARSAVLAANRSNVIFAGGGNSVDAIAAADTLTMADIIAATSALKGGPDVVPKFADGSYHCHLPVAGTQQLLADPLVDGKFQNPDRIPQVYRDAALGFLGGAMLIENASTPDQNSVEAAGAASGLGLVASGAGASFCSPEIGGDVINNAGIPLNITLVYGRGHAMEMYIPPGSTTADNALSGGAPTPQASSEGVNLSIDRCEFLIRPPVDVMGEVTTFAWKGYFDWPIPSDITAAGALARRFRRMVAIVHA